MFKRVISFVKALRQTSAQLKKQYAFELKDIISCPKTGKHLIEIKVVGKGQCITCEAQEIVADNDFIIGFSPDNIRTIACLAMNDKYETIFYQEKIKKSYEIVRSENINGKKTILFRNKITGDSMIKSIFDFADEELISNLESNDAYHLGYLAGQEQSFQHFARLKLLSSKKDETNL